MKTIVVKKLNTLYNKPFTFTEIGDLDVTMPNNVQLIIIGN